MAKLNQRQLSEIYKALNDIQKKAEKEVSTLIAKTAFEAADKAVSNLVTNQSVDTGHLKNSIRAERVNKNTMAVRASADYAAYIEFGTGREVSLRWLRKLQIPESYARQFKGKGIKEVNIYPKPYFFPAIRYAFNNLDQRLNDLAKKLAQ